MDKLGAGTRAWITDENVRNAAERAADQYESDKIKYNFQSGDDIVFNSTNPSVYKNLINAICAYAGKAQENNKSPEQEYTANVKEKRGKDISFEQYSKTIKTANDNGVTKWKYVPYGLVYPEESNKAVGTEAARKAAGSQERLFHVNRYNKNYKNYIDAANTYFSMNPNIDGTTAAKNLDKVLDKRKLINSNFNANLEEGDQLMDDYCNVVNNRLNDKDFRMEYFRYAENNPNSEFHRYLIFCGYTDFRIKALANGTE